jgi:hypothetical protein
MKKIRETLNLTVPQVMEEMESLGFVITYATLNNYEKSMKKGISIDLIQYYIFKGINLKYLMKRENEGEPIFDQDVKKTNIFFTERRFVMDLLQTAMDSLQEEENNLKKVTPL